MNASNDFIEVTPKPHGLGLVPVWMSSDDIEQSLYYLLDAYDIDWGCQPRPEWFERCDIHNCLRLKLPVLQLIWVPHGSPIILVVSGINRLLWMMRTNLNETMVEIISDQRSEWETGGYRICPVQSGDTVYVNYFDTAFINRLKSRTSSGWLTGFKQRIKR